MGVFDEWVDQVLTVQLTDETKPLVGRLVEHGTRGIVLAVRLNKKHKSGVFEGMTEQGECTVFIPWFRVKLALTPTHFDSVA